MLFHSYITYSFHFHKGNIGTELKAAMSTIEVVTKQVRIMNVYGLTSLHFLNNLRVIEGQGISQNEYVQTLSLPVVDIIILSIV